MNHDLIKALAKQAGGTPYTNRHFPGKMAVAFSGEALDEFVRLVREGALEEVARQFNPNNGAWPVNAIIQTIRSLR